MATVYVLLLLAVLVFVIFVLYVTRPPSRKQSPDSELKKVPNRKPASGVTRPSQPDELPSLDYPKSNGSEGSSTEALERLQKNMQERVRRGRS